MAKRVKRADSLAVGDILDASHFHESFEVAQIKLEKHPHLNSWTAIISDKDEVRIMTPASKLVTVIV